MINISIFLLFQNEMIFVLSFDYFSCNFISTYYYYFNHFFFIICLYNLHTKKNLLKIYYIICVKQYIKFEFKKKLSYIQSITNTIGCYNFKLANFFFVCFIFFSMRRNVFDFCQMNSNKC